MPRSASSRDPDPLPARVVPAGADAGQAAPTAELPGRVRAELLVVGELGGAGAGPGIGLADRAAVGAHPLVAVVVGPRR